MMAIEANQAYRKGPTCSDLPARRTEGCSPHHHPEERLIRRLREVCRVHAKIVTELGKDNPCGGTVKRELLELELGALDRDRAGIEEKLGLQPWRFQQSEEDPYGRISTSRISERSILQPTARSVPQAHDHTRNSHARSRHEGKQCSSSVPAAQVVEEPESSVGVWPGPLSSSSSSSLSSAPPSVNTASRKLLTREATPTAYEPRRPESAPQKYWFDGRVAAAPGCSVNLPRRSSHGVRRTIRPERVALPAFSDILIEIPPHQEPSLCPRARTHHTAEDRRIISWDEGLPLHAPAVGVVSSPPASVLLRKRSFEEVPESRPQWRSTRDETYCWPSAEPDPDAPEPTPPSRESRADLPSCSRTRPRRIADPGYTNRLPLSPLDCGPDSFDLGHRGWAGDRDLTASAKDSPARREDAYRSPWAMHRSEAVVGSGMGAGAGAEYNGSHHLEGRAPKARARESNHGGHPRRWDGSADGEPYRRRNEQQQQPPPPPPPPPSYGSSAFDASERRSMNGFRGRERRADEAGTTPAAMVIDALHGHRGMMGDSCADGGGDVGVVRYTNTNTKDRGSFGAEEIMGAGTGAGAEGRGERGGPCGEGGRMEDHDSWRYSARGQDSVERRGAIQSRRARVATAMAQASLM